MEAEKYHGPSLIIAYAPCINHGINMSKSQEEEKRAVDCGYWQLYRYNPVLKEEGKNPFTLDSKEPTGDYQAFHSRRNALLFAEKDAARSGGKALQRERRGEQGPLRRVQETCRTGVIQHKRSSLRTSRCAGSFFFYAGEPRRYARQPERSRFFRGGLCPPRRLFRIL